MKVSILAILALILASVACTSPDWVTPTAIPAQTKPVPTVMEVIETRSQIATVTASQSLHVRRSATDKAAVIGYLYHGDAVTLTGKCQTNWAQIVWKSSTAWVNSKFLSDNKCKQ